MPVETADYNALCTATVPLRRDQGRYLLSLAELRALSASAVEEDVRAGVERAEHLFREWQRYREAGGAAEEAAALLDWSSLEEWYHRADLLLSCLDLTDTSPETLEPYRQDAHLHWPELRDLLDGYARGEVPLGTVPDRWWTQLRPATVRRVYEVGSWKWGNLRLRSVHLSALHSPHPNDLPYLSASEWVNLVDQLDLPIMAQTGYQVPRLYPHGTQVCYLSLPAGQTRLVRWVE